MVYLRDGVLRAEYHGRNGDNVRELDVIVGVVFDNGKWREVDDNATDDKYSSRIVVFILLIIKPTSFIIVKR